MPSQPPFPPLPQDQAFGRVAAPNGPAPVPHPLHWLPTLCNLPSDTGDDMGPHYSTAADMDPSPSTSLSQACSTLCPPSNLGSAWVGHVERPSNATNIARPPGIWELVINSPLKPAFAHLTGFSIQKRSKLCHLAAFCRHRTSLCSLGAIQQTRTVWGEKHHREASRESQGTQRRGSPCHPLHGRCRQAGGRAKPQSGEVTTAPWRGTRLGRAAPGWAAAGEMALRKGTALACSPPAQPRRCSLQSHRPSKPAIPWGMIPGLKNRRKISLTGSWKTAGASHADRTNPPCGRSPRAAGNST